MPDFNLIMFVEVGFFMQKVEEIKREMEVDIETIRSILGEESEYLLGFDNPRIKKESLHLPGPDFVDRVFMDSDRPTQVLRNLKSIFNHGRLSGTGYLSILPVDQGVEHSAASSFAPNPIYFDPENIIKLAVYGGCNAVASTLGVLGSLSRKYAHKIPFIVKINHNELLSYPNDYDQRMFAEVEQAWEMGAAAVGCTIYFGSSKEICSRQIEEVSKAFKKAHELGLATFLWCYLSDSAFNVDGVNYHASADLTGQANHLGVTLEADSLFWDQQRDSITTESFVKITKRGNIQTGYGLESDSRLTNVRIKKRVKAKFEDVEEIKRK